MGAPSLGVEGGAIATLVARFIDCVALVFYMRWGNKLIEFRFKKLFHLDRMLFRDFMRYSMPVTINEVSIGLTVMMSSVIVGHMGEQAVAAMSVTTTLWQVLNSLMFAVAQSTCALVGEAIGSGDNRRAMGTANSSLLVGMGFAVVLAGLLFVLRIPILGLYNLPPETLNLALLLMNMTIVLLLFDPMHLIPIIGIIRGGGDTRFAMFVSAGSSWLFAVPLSFILGLILKAPVWLVFLSLRSDLLIRAVVCFFRIQSGKWLHSVTRERISDDRLTV